MFNIAWPDSACKFWNMDELVARSTIHFSLFSKSAVVEMTDLHMSNSQELNKAGCLRSLVERRTGLTFSISSVCWDVSMSSVSSYPVTLSSRSIIGSASMIHLKWVSAYPSFRSIKVGNKFQRIVSPMSIYWTFKTIYTTGFNYFIWWWVPMVHDYFIW